VHPTTFMVTPWHDPKQIESFCEAWHISFTSPPDHVILQHDRHGEGCGTTKNKGIHRAIDERDAEIIIVLDDDCFPDEESGGVRSLDMLIDRHEQALKPQPVRRFATVTDPPSRGTPYQTRSYEMPVAASMGFWSEIGDYCAVRQLAHHGAPMTHRRTTIYGDYFPLCGMNLAFRPADWMPWATFIDVPRFDDIWMGWLWQREAYRRGYCFNLNGPDVRHSRQSNVWANLRDEAEHLEANDSLWVKIATTPYTEYGELRSLLPV
jgi:hypothetical protein